MMTRMQDEVHTPEPATERLGLLARIRLAVGVVATLAVILFLLQNLQQVDVRFLWFDWSIRMTWALMASTAFGVLATAIFLLAAARRPQKKRSRDAHQPHA
jgi:uncharacterized integral membrane protein